MAEPIWSIEALHVLGLLRDGRKWHGYAIEQATGMKRITAYRILHRFHERGLLSREVERINPTLTTRMPKIFYQITEDGHAEIRRLRKALTKRA